MGHSSFVSQESCQMNRFLGIITGEGLYAATMWATTLLGVEPHGAMTRSAKFPVRLKLTKYTNINKSNLIHSITKENVHSPHHADNAATIKPNIHSFPQISNLYYSTHLWHLKYRKKKWMKCLWLKMFKDKRHKNFLVRLTYHCLRMPDRDVQES